MHFHGPVVRPPADADSVIIEITVGCTHNSCTFCNYYEGFPFWVAPLSQVEEDLQEAKIFRPNAKKIWASGGNPFALAPSLLIERADLIRKYFPEARILTYARIDDLKNKTIQDLREIHAHGISDLLIGIESGDDEALTFVNKGYTAADIVEGCGKLDAAGLPYRVIYLGGLLGEGKLVESAKKSARVWNEIHPYFMFAGTVSLLPGTPLYAQAKAGTYHEATEKERTEELRAFLSGLENRIVVDTRSPLSAVQILAQFPEEKEAALDTIDDVLSHFSDEKQQRLHQLRSRVTHI